MTLELTPDEYNRLQTHISHSNAISQRMKMHRRGGRQKQQKDYSIPPDRKRVTKQVTDDIFKENGTWIRTVTRAQINTVSGRLYLQTGLSVRDKTITHVSSVGVIYEDMATFKWPHMEAITNEK